MINRNTTNFHVEYMAVTKHWSPSSEKFAGADALITALDKGWEMEDEVICEDVWFAGMRQTRVYHVILQRDEERIEMPVLHNPYINRMLSSDAVHIKFKNDSVN